MLMKESAIKTNPDIAQYTKMANAIRFLSIDAVQKANSGHPGLPMGMADVATVLYKDYLKYDPQNPTWSNRDRFVLSAGHGSMLLYSLLYLTGYKKMSLDQIQKFRQLGAITAGHPEVEQACGIETTTGPLGQGISNAVGMALAERLLAARFGNEIVDHFTYVIASDGDLMEGVSHESSSFAGHLSLGKLIVFYDDNGISIDGSTDLSFTEDSSQRYEAYGWHVQKIDGHDVNDIKAAIEAAQKDPRPSLIACKTVIGFGSPNKSGKSSAHGSPLGEEEIRLTRDALDWPHEPFEVPLDTLTDWREIGARGGKIFKEWEKKFLKMPLEQNQEFKRCVVDNQRELPKNFSNVIAKLKEYALEEPKVMATRQCSGTVLNHLSEILPEMVGGSADLSPSNSTRTSKMKPISKDNFEGKYIHYGVREHGMAGIMNGMALHRGVVPYAGTFLCFADYSRPAIRLAALMNQHVIHVMTHDSIGLGEDGPTHQPVEHIASLRAIPNLAVYRPCDMMETIESWECALKNRKQPAILALSRQGLSPVRAEVFGDDQSINHVEKGAYILKESVATPTPMVTIFASGSEVKIALDARSLLEDKNIGVRVISVPCLENFAKQDADYQMSLTCNDSIKVAVEAGVRQGWDHFVGPHGIFVGMDSFGASAPASELYQHFKITAEEIISRVQLKLDQRS